MLALCFLLLLVTFRSIVIPIKAVLLNLLSVSAAYGLLVLVFQHRWAEGILGFHSNGAITSWLPLFMFVILFGLSMDYHVFILSRVKELVDGGMPTEQAVATGIKRTAGTVTSAAVVMVAVFAIFVTLRTLDIKQMGFGLAAAILIDATIVRGVLAAGDDEAARRLELVPAAVARVAAASRRRRRSVAGGPAGASGRATGRPALEVRVTSHRQGRDDGEAAVSCGSGSAGAARPDRRRPSELPALCAGRCSASEGFEVVGEAEDGDIRARPRRRAGARARPARHPAPGHQTASTSPSGSSRVIRSCRSSSSPRATGPTTAR